MRSEVAIAPARKWLRFKCAKCKSKFGVPSDWDFGAGKPKCFNCGRGASAEYLIQQLQKLAKADKTASQNWGKWRAAMELFHIHRSKKSANSQWRMFCSLCHMRVKNVDKLLVIASDTGLMFALNGVEKRACSAACAENARRARRRDTIRRRRGIIRSRRVAAWKKQLQQIHERGTVLLGEME